MMPELLFPDIPEKQALSLLYFLYIVPLRSCKPRLIILPLPYKPVQRKATPTWLQKQMQRHFKTVKAGSSLQNYKKIQI